MDGLEKVKRGADRNALTIMVAVMEYLRSISDAPKLVGVETYIAGASLFLPIVMKKSEMSWKESSSTVSTDIS